MQKTDKFCAECQRSKPLIDFYITRHGSISNHCIRCTDLLRHSTLDDPTPHLRKMTKVYALVNPLNSEVHYVGITRQKESYRYATHLSTARVNPTNTPHCAWIHSLLSINIQPGMIVLERMPSEQYNGEERKWMKRIKERGDFLYNLHGGSIPYKDWTPQKLRVASHFDYLKQTYPNHLKYIELIEGYWSTP